MSSTRAEIAAGIMFAVAAVHVNGCVDDGGEVHHTKTQSHTTHRTIDHFV